MVMRVGALPVNVMSTLLLIKALRSPQILIVFSDAHAKFFRRGFDPGHMALSLGVVA